MMNYRPLTRREQLEQEIVEVEEEYKLILEKEESK